MIMRPTACLALLALALTACAEGGGYRVIGASASLDTSRGLTTSTYDERGTFEILDEADPDVDPDAEDEALPPPRRR